MEIRLYRVEMSQYLYQKPDNRHLESVREFIYGVFARTPRQIWFAFGKQVRRATWQYQETQPVNHFC